VTSQTTAEFRRLLVAVPARVRAEARAAYRTFQDDPAHPGLQFKRVGLREPVYSARIGLHYRAVGVFRGDTIIGFWIGPHAAYDKLRF